MNTVKFNQAPFPFIGMWLLSVLISFSAQASTNVSGNQSGVWTKANSPYIITGAVTVTAGHTLNIQPGVTVIFSIYNADLTINGTLNAIGTSSDSIRFKGTYNAIYNTYYGGSVYLNTNSSTLSYVRTDSLGYSNHAIVIPDQVTPVLSNCTIKANNRNLDIYSWIGGAKNFSFINGTVYVRSATVGYDATMPKLGSTGIYYMLGAITMSAGTRLTMKPGVTLISPVYSYDLVVNGVLDAQGTAADSIRIKGRAYIPYNTYYGGTLSINGDSSKLNYVSIDSMGYYTSSIIIADNITPTITNTTITHTNTNDIYTWIGGGKNFLNLTAVVLIKSQTIGTDATIAKIGGNSYYKMNGGVTMNDGTKLTVMAGAKVIFPHYSHSLVVNGIMNAQGTAADSIRFIGTAYIPTAASDHGGAIYINKDSSVLNYVVIDSMGDAGYVTSSLFLSSNSTLSNSSIRNSETQGLTIADNTKPIVANAVIKNSSGYDIYTWIGGVENFSNLTGIVSVKPGSLGVNLTMPKYSSTNTYYNLLGGITVNAGSKLTIKPGVKMVFPYMYTNLVVNGLLDAQGTAADSVRFIGKANSSNPSSDHGGNIVLNKDSSIINYAVIDSMGDSYYYTQTLAIASNSSVKNTTIKNSETQGIVVSDNLKPVITNTVVLKSGSYDLNTWVGGSDSLSNFTGNVNVRSGNLGVNATFPKYNTSNVYYNLLGTITVNAGSKLTIKPGVTVGFPYMYTSLVVNGRLDAQGTAADSIRFIGTANPANGSSDHGGIIALNSDSSIINYAVIDSMGDSYYFASALGIVAYSSVSNTVIKNTESSGITVSDNIIPVLNNIVIKNSGVYDVNNWIGGMGKANNLSGIVNIRSGNLGVYSGFPKLTGSGSYYRLLGPVTINDGAKLTMKPGVKVLLPNFSVNITVNGILDAQGTAADSIKIYGRNAPEYNGSSTHGGAIYLNKDSSILKYVSIDSMGDSYYYNGSLVIADNVAPTITNSSIAHSETADIYSWVGVGKKIDSLKGVISLRSYSITSSATMYRVKGSYYRMTGTVTLDAGNTLTVQPGVTLVSPAANVNLTANGVLVAIGNKTDSIKFKGARNLTNSTLYGGGVYINHDSSVLKFVVIDSMGDNSGSYGGLVVSGGLNMQYCNVKNNKNAGIYFSTSKANVSCTNITKNENGIIVYNSKPTLNNCNIFSNTNFGANNIYKVYSADATSCYWGNASGPFHPTLNPGGTGNAVSDSITFIPFKTTSVVPVLPFIASFSPGAGATDTVIVIRGIRFTSTTAVSFGGKPAKSFTVLNDSTINAVVGTGNSGFVKVTKSVGSDSLAGFTYCSGVVMTTDFSYATNFADVIFTNNSVNATSYFWTFGDATTSTEANPVHHYTSNTPYTVCLITNNACSRDIDTVCKSIPLIGYTFDDADRDGLFDATETALYGTSNTVFDSNNDGLADGVNVFIGFAVLMADTDGDGISNLQEIINGTNPLLSDTDYDGVADNVDAYPLDRYRSKIPPTNSSDHVAPVITLSEPF